MKTISITPECPKCRFRRLTGRDIPITCKLKGSRRWPPRGRCGFQRAETRNLSRYERKGRREAATGKWGIAVSQAQFLRGLPKGGYEPGTGVAERLRFDVLHRAATRAQ